MIMEREVPEAVYIECTKCREQTAHEVLKGKMGKASLEGTLKCMDCGKTITTTIPMPRQIVTRVIVSDGPVSYQSSTVLEEDELLMEGDEFYLEDGLRVRIASIENNDNKRVRKARAPKVKTIWAQKFDILNVKVTVNDGTKSYSRRIPALPDDEYAIGQLLSLEDMDCFIHAIKTRDRLINRGTTEARNVVRIYGRYKRKSIPVLDLEDDI